LVLSCKVNFGASGSPIFIIENGVPKIASVVSAKAEWKDRDVALGTSLPELSATLVAAYYRNSDVALGNVVGSNLFNILAVLGVTLMFADIPIDPVFLKFDIWVMLSAAVVLWLFALFGAKIGRLAGIAFLCGYGGYIWSLFSG
jgi:cation:H+ antiporter